MGRAWHAPPPHSPSSCLGSGPTWLSPLPTHPPRAPCRCPAGVLQVEAMAQLAGIAMLDPENTAAKGLFFFGGIENCRFRKPVVPGDVLVRRQASRHACTRHDRTGCCRAGLPPDGI